MIYQGSDQEADEIYRIRPCPGTRGDDHLRSAAPEQFIATGVVIVSHDAPRPDSRREPDR